MCRADRAGDRRRPAAGQHRLGGVEDDATGRGRRRRRRRRPPATCSCSGVWASGLAGGRRRRGEHVAGRGPRRPRTQLAGRVGGGPGHGEHGALDGVAHRGVAASVACRSASASTAAVALVRARVGRSGRQIAPSIWLRITPELPRAPSSAPRRERGQRGAAGRDSGVAVGRLPERVAGGRDGEEHVGAGVAVGHRVDVEGVDLLARGAQRVGRRCRRTAARRAARTGRRVGGLPSSVPAPVGSRRVGPWHPGWPTG